MSHFWQAHSANFITLTECSDLEKYVGAAVLRPVASCVREQHCPLSAARLVAPLGR